MPRSDTPRTNAMIYAKAKDIVTGDLVDVVHADDCRALEREISHWRAMHTGLQAAFQAMRDAETNRLIQERSADTRQHWASYGWLGPEKP